MSTPTALGDFFRDQAGWRWSKAEEYPEDKRNEQSARALEDLARWVELEGDGSGTREAEFVPAVEEHMFGASLGGEEAKRAVARYGFGYEVDRTTHEEFMRELWVHCMEDAYEFAREHEDDPTGALLPFELEAAKEDVSLPPQYWSLRPKSLVSELEETVDSYLRRVQEA